MAAENMNMLNTRIKLKYDTYANWTSKNPVLLEGEVAIATIPAGANVDTSTNENPGTTMQRLPNVVFKVGQKDANGDLIPYNQLPFVSALAADVYAWAKAPNKPTYYASDIEGLEDFIAGEIQDTDTQYTIQPVAGTTYKFELLKKNKGEADTAFTHVCDIDMSDVDVRLDELDRKVGSDTVANQIGNALADINLTKLESAEGSGKVLAYIEQASGEVTAEMRSLIEADIPALTIAKTTGLQDALDAKQDDLTFTDDYVAETSVVATKKYVDDAANNAVAINNNDAAVEHQFVTEAKQENGEVKVTRRALTKEDIPAIDMTQVTDLDKEFAKKQNNLEFMTAYDASSNKVATQKEVEDLNKAIGDMDMALVEVGNGEILASAVQEDGTVTITKRALASSDFKANLIPEAAVNGLTDALAGKQPTIVWADGYEYNASNNKAATVDYVSSVIGGLNGAMHFEGKIEGASFEEAVASYYGSETPEAGDVVLYGLDEYVYDANNQAWVKLGNEGIYQTTEQARADHQALSEAIALKQDELGFEGAYNKTSNKVVTKSAMDEAIAAATDIDVASKKADGQVVLGVAQKDGAIEVEHGALTAAHIPTLAINKIDGLQAVLDGKQDDLTFMTPYSASNPVATKAEIDNLDAAIKDMDLSEVNAAAGHIITGLKQEDGVVTATTRALNADDFAADLIPQTAVKDLDDALAAAAKAGTDAAATAESNAKAFATQEIGDAIANIDFAVTAEEGKFVTGFTVEDGALKASTTSTVDAKHLTQTTGDYLVFDCGTATINI